MRTASVLFLLAFVTPLVAQPERYELGQRLKAFEAAWDKQSDVAARKRAVAGVGKVTSQFFAFQFGEAGRTLDEARFALESDKPVSDDLKWATALYPDVPKRLIDGSADLTVNLKAYYPVKTKRPDGLGVRLTLGAGKPVTVTPDKLPQKVSVPLPPAGDERRREDLTLTMEVLLADKPVVKRAVLVSVIDAVETLAERLPADAKLVKPPTLESASIVERAELLKDLAKGTIPETDVPAAKRLAEAILMGRMTNVGQGYFTPAKPGDHWVTVPTADKDTTPCRLFVPKGLDAKTPVPLVVALHGAGGSENLFFEGYGAGHIVKLCEKRGWLLVAPRCGLAFGLGGSVPVGEIIDKLAERYPIDPKRVFVVGHSMGAAGTIDAVQKYPGRFAAAAALGGGGRVRKAEAFADLPVFVGVGEQDFARRTAKALHTALTDGKAKQVTFKEYPAVEHLLIVREALGDVFDVFDTLAKR
jgi:predicted esterase